MTAKFRESRIRLPVDPESALSELERIRIAHDGKLVPQEVVKASEPKTAPLHPCFEWRNSVAADLYRIWQARNLIKAVRIEYIDEQGKQSDIPQYVNVRTPDETGKMQQYYQATQVAIKHLNEWELAVHGVQVKLDAAQRAVDDLQKVANGDSDRLARITLAVRSIDAAIAALRH